MADLNKIKSNVGKMVDQNAPEADIDAYLSSEGVTPDQVRAHNAVAAPPNTAPAKSGTFSDVVKSTATGLAKGGAALVGLPGDVSQLFDRGLDYLTGSNVAGGQHPGRFTTEDVNKGIQSVVGDYHKPQTTAGKYAETISSFAPAAIAPGGAAMRAARVLIPGAASETAGELTAGTPLEPYARVAGAVAGGVAAGPAIRSINSITSRVGTPIQNPNIAARGMLADAVQRDGGAQAVNDNLTNYRGASNPALIDVTGNNVRRLVRSAASGGSGEAQNVATTYADRIAGNLQDNAMTLTRKLTPGITDSADLTATNLEQAQRDLATKQYREPYTQPANLTDEARAALSGPDGRSAIQRALRGAQARQDTQQAAELHGLLNGDSGAVSAGALDRVRIAMRERANLATRNGAGDIASGLRGRTGQIDSALDATPGLADARASYADYARQQDALELGRTGLNASPESYAATISDLAAKSPSAPQAAGVGYRQSLTDAIQRPAEGATGVLNRIATSGTQTQNLSATFGKEAAQDYQTGVGNEIDRLRNARFISPNTGSQTQLRIQDSGLVDIPTSAVGLLGRIWDHVQRGGMLTEQERTALVRMGTTEANVRNLAKANPSITSRTLTTALLGNQTGNGR